MIRTVMLAALTFLFLGSLAAEARCRGKSLLEGQSQATLDALEAAASRHPYHEGRYFRLTKGGKTSHIIGTLHFDDRDIRKIPAFFQDRIKEADNVLVEILVEEAAQLMFYIMARPELILNQDGTDLRDSFTKEEWKVLERTLRKRGMPKEFLPQLQPWFVSNLLSEIPCTQGQGRILDLEIIDFAEKNGVYVQGLETKDDLIPLLTNVDNDDGIKNIKVSLNNLKYGPDLAVTVKELYMKGEIAKIIEFGHAFARRSFGKEEMVKIKRAIEQDLLVNRNKAWMKNLLPALGDGNAVVAVGAGHLYGREGLLRLLEKRGYKVERIVLN